MPLNTCRWSRQRPPRLGLVEGSSGASRSHSSSVISNRLFTVGFYPTSALHLNPRTDPRNKP
jgi:hypothetical protein